MDIINHLLKDLKELNIPVVRQREFGYGEYIVIIKCSKKKLNKIKWDVDTDWDENDGEVKVKEEEMENYINLKYTGR